MAEIKLRVSDEIAGKIKQTASDNSLTVNKLMTQIIEKYLSGQSIDTPVELPDVIKMKVSPEEKESIANKAKEVNLPVSAYLNELINKRSTVNIDISINDLHDLEDEICSMVTTINGILTVLLRSDKVYENDIQKILSLMTEINDKFNKIYQQELNDRKKLYNESRKKVFYEIDRNKLTRQTRNDRKGE